jgi:preprotein translocase subunit SecB
MSNTEQGNGAEQGPSLNVLAQYVKDYSFESPNTPGILANPPQSHPEVQIQVNVNARPFAGDDIEVELKIEVTAGKGAEMLYAIELSYAGMFRVLNVRPEDMQPLVLIECPRLLFPFARQILAEASINGGFPPLMLQPIDFVALFRQRMSEANPGALS